MLPKQIWWLGDGIVGDDTDGHIDDMTRFVSTHMIVSALEDNSKDENYKALQENWERLHSFYFEDGSKPELIALPMPSPVSSMRDNDCLPLMLTFILAMTRCGFQSLMTPVIRKP